MRIKQILSKVCGTNDSIDKIDAPTIDYLKKSLEQSDTALKSAEKSLAQLSNDYETKCEELNSAIERNKSLFDENEALNDMIDGLRNQCKMLSCELNELRETAKRDSDFVVRIIIECFQNTPVLEPESVGKTQAIKYFSNQLMRILSKMGITPIEDIGILANPQFHRIENIVITNIPEQSGLISQSFGIGFKKGDQCIVEQPVEVYKYRK